MRYAVRAQGEIVVVEIHGPWVNDPEELVVHQEVKKRLQEGTGAGGRHVMIDLKNCTFMASGGIGGLVSIKASAAARGGKVVLCGVNERVRRALIVSEMWDRFENHPTLEEALAAQPQAPNSA